MSLGRSESFEVFARLLNRYGIEPDVIPQHPLLSRVIVPITNLDELAQDLSITSDTKDISAGSGVSEYFVVPDGKLWKIHLIDRPATAASSSLVFTIDGTNIKLDQQTAINFFHWPRGLPMKENTSIGMLNTGDGGDTARTLIVYYAEIDAYKA